MRRWRLLGIAGSRSTCPTATRTPPSSATPGPGTTVRRSRRPGWSRWPSAAPTPSSPPRSTPTGSGRRLSPSACIRGCAPMNCSRRPRVLFLGRMGCRGGDRGGAAVAGPDPTRPARRAGPRGRDLHHRVDQAVDPRAARAAARRRRAGADLSDINAVPDAYDERGLPVIHLARVVETTCRPGRHGTGELITLLSTILQPGGHDGARADELAAAYHQRWEEETANDQLKPTPRPRAGAALPAARPGPPGDLGLPHRAPRDQRADRRASAAADLDPDRVSFAQALRMIRRTATGTADIPPEDWHDRLPAHLAEIATLLIPPRRERTCPRAVKRARHNSSGSRSPASRQRPPPSTGHDTSGCNRSAA